MRDGSIRKCCPMCGGKIEIGVYYQHARIHSLNKDGRMSKRYTVCDNGPEGTITACCIGCGEYWEMGQFSIDQDGRFIDYKCD